MGHNIIELNGKRYDAVTGELVGSSKAEPKKTTPLQGRVIDGFIRPSAHTGHPLKASTTTIPKPQPVAPPKMNAVKKPDIVRNAQHIKAHHPQKPKTLMRHAVRKPDVTRRAVIKAQAPSELAAAPIKTIAPRPATKLSVKTVDPSRMARAKQIPRSSHIERFNATHGTLRPSTAQPARIQLASIPVKTPPTASRIHPITRPRAAEPAQKHTDIFEAAIAHAMSHKQPIPKGARKHRKLLNAMAGVAAFLIIGGFIAYLNMPTIELNIASVKAGFHANMPGYKPNGFALAGGVKANDRKITLTFRSGDSHYTVSQQASDWNSQTLLENYVATNTTTHEAVQSKGRTIYIYNGNNAAWVNGGVRYDITGNAYLSSDEIVALATSM